MKRIISLTIALCLVLGSFSFVFASATQWDTSDQANLRYIATSVTSGGSLYNLVNNIYSRLGTISNNITDIKSYLFDSNHGIAYWVHAINTWMSPIYTAIQNTPTELESIKRLLGYVSYEGETEVIDPYLAYQTKGVAQYLYDQYQFQTTSAWATPLLINGSIPYIYQFNPALGGQYFNVTHAAGSQPYNFYLMLRSWMNSSVAYYQNQYNKSLVGYSDSQTYTLWTGDSLATASFTPTSQTNGLYTWLSKIQAPVARLSYVLASDERIEAQEKAAANEEAVVNNFIDSSGSGSVGVSDFGSLSNASGAMKSNFETGQSAAGVFNVFDDSHFLYLSQSAADQLDTTGSNNSNKLLKSSDNDYDTPALDRYYKELNKILEVNKDD